LVIFEHKDEVADLFKKRCSLNEDVEEKALAKIDKKIKRKVEKFVEKETANIEYRFIQEFEAKLEELDGHFSKDIDKLKKKHPLIYHKWANDMKASFENRVSKYMEAENDLAEIAANLDKPLSSDGQKILYLESQLLKHLIESNRELQESLKLSRHRKTHTLASKIMRVITTQIMVIVRWIEILKHWENAEEADRLLMEDLFYWDLNTLSNFLLMLPSKKKMLKAEKKPKRELLQTLFG